MANLSRREIIQGLALAAIPIATGVGAQGLKVPSTITSRVRSTVVEKVEERLKSIPFESQKIGGMFADRMRTNMEARLLKVDEVALLRGYVYPRTPVEQFEG